MPRGILAVSLLSILTVVLPACDRDPAATDDIHFTIVASADSAALTVGDSVQLSATVSREDGQAVVNPVVGWVTTDESVARVTASGRVFGLRSGTAVIIASSNAAADSVIIRVSEKGGGLPGDTTTPGVRTETWTPLNGPHFITDTLRVAHRLIIEAGTVVHARPGAMLLVHRGGSLKAVGRADQRIRFLAVDTVQGWLGITASGTNTEAGGTLEFDYVDVEHGDVGVGFQSGANIDHSYFRRASVASGGNFANVTLRNSVVEDGDVSISNGTFEETIIRRGILAFGPAQPGSGSVIINGGRVEDSPGVALTIGSMSIFRVPNITVLKAPEIVRSRGGIATMPVSNFFAIWPTPASQAGLRDNVDRTANLWSIGSSIPHEHLHLSSHVEWKLTTMIGVREIKSLTLDPGTTVIPDPFIRVTGPVSASGTAAQPITIRCEMSVRCGITLAGSAPSRISNATFVNAYLVGADSVHLDRINSNSYVAIGNGSSIRDSEIHDVTTSYFVPTAALTLGDNVKAERVVIRRVRTPDNAAAIAIRGNNVQVLQCDVVDNANDGIVVSAGTNVQVHDCNIENNGSFGLSNLTTAVVDASRNWWGDPAGPNVGNASRVGGPVDTSYPLTSRRP